ncbi:hypothetical protein [Rhodopirellula bahusiensis]|uniref:hypothetical protein n=1 Tax=Rhodopirellula bahusiensis TaxID=2014065 RepID=UPI00117AEE93|nr:hypothetical protein [Rhodopirellula bahusiensis]
MGGSANINGILYQIIGTLNETVSLHFHPAECSGDDVVEASLIMEPDSGGDLQYESGGERVVQQWKAKARGGTWSLKKIVEEVLPDLYLAVPDEHLDCSCRYEFITEGRIGDWTKAYDFFSSLNRKPPADRLEKSLDDSSNTHTRAGNKISDLALFRWVVKAVRKREGLRDEAIELSQRKVWHLLARFRMQENVTHELQTARLNQFLIHHVEFAEDVDAKRRELCGVLLDAASQGPQELNAESLLRRASIPLYSFRDWERLHARLSKRLVGQLAKEGYRKESDVRKQTPGLRDEIVVTGDSGQGKTWWLARVATNMDDSGALVVWVPAARGAKDVEAYVVHEVWNYGLQRDAPIALERLANRREQTQPDAPSPWLIVCVDDIKSIVEANALLHLDWERWGIRLLMTAPLELATDLSLSQLKPNVTVPDFSHSELRDYLTEGGVGWTTVPSDVRELIRRPVLSKIFVDIACTEAEFRPRNEYDLVEAAWNRVSSPISQALLTRTAGRLYKEPQEYPWQLGSLLESGFTPDLVKQLITEGWLKYTDSTHIAFWHPRFLCWAYATYLCQEYRNKKLSIDELIEETQACLRGNRQTRQLSLGYVPMDLLWQMSGAEENSDCWMLIKALETSDGLGHEDETFYRHLLASLGKRVINPIVRRLQDIEHLQHSAIPSCAAEALSIIGRSHPVLIADTARDCLESGNEAMIELGLQLAVHFPSSANVDRIWNVYCSRILARKENATDYSAQERACSAFEAVVAIDLDWLRTQLLESDPNDRCFRFLVYALGNLDLSAAAEVWEATKERLLSEILPSDRRCMIGCITSHDDASGFPILQEWADAEEDFVGVTALQALAHRDPSRALEVLGRVPLRQLELYAGSIGRSLFAEIPDQTCTAVLTLVADGASVEMTYIKLAASNGDRISPQVAEAILDLVDTTLGEHLESDELRNANAPWHDMDLVDKLHGQVMLEALRKRRGTSLETRLLTFSESRVDRDSHLVDHQFELATNLLRRIAGTGFTKLVNAMILSPCRHTRLKGCEQAIVRPDRTTRKALAAESISDVMWDSGASGTNLTQMRSIDSLAAIGEDAAVVTGILKWGLRVSPYIGDLRAGQEPMNDQDLSAALEVIQNPDDPTFANAILAIGQSGRQEYRERIEDVLMACDPGDALCQYCLLALEDLPSDCNRTLSRLVEQFHSGHFKYAVLKAISRCELPNESLLQLLPDDGQLDEIDQRLVAYLVSSGFPRAKIKSHIEKLVSSGGSRMHDTVALLDPSEHRHQELLWERTLDDDQTVCHIGSRAQAIRMLGTTAPDAAFEIGISTLGSDRRDRNSISVVLLDLDPSRAVAELITVACSTYEKTICSEIARAFRAKADPGTLSEELGEALRSSDRKRRRVAAFLASFCGSGICDEQLRSVAFSDRSWAVCAEAQAAIRSRQRESEAIELCETVAKLQPCEVWGTIDCILGLTDPGVLTLPNDPIGFISVLSEQPYALRKRTYESIRKLKKKTNDGMKSLAGKWKD